MSRSLTELSALQGKCEDQADRSVPIICAGDVFHKWNPPPELINFAIDYLPFMYAIPGQHDLPLHDYDQIVKSAFYTLIKAGKISELSPDCEHHIPATDIVACGFPWNAKLRSLSRRSRAMQRKEGKTFIAVVHAYCWIMGHSYPGAPQSQAINYHLDRLKHYNTWIFGDNHKGFLAHGRRLFNCGGLMRRNSDEFKYNPQVGLITETGEVRPYRLSKHGDKMAEPDEWEGPIDNIAELELENFVESLSALCDVRHNFSDQVRRYMDNHDVNDSIQKIINRALDQ